MPVWIHTHCPNCNMPYVGAASECGACGRAREPLIIPPPVVEAARPETYAKSVPPSVLRFTPSDGLIVATAVLIALVVIYLRLYFGL